MFFLDSSASGCGIIHNQTAKHNGHMSHVVTVDARAGGRERLKLQPGGKLQLATEVADDDYSTFAMTSRRLYATTHAMGGVNN